MTDQFYKKFKQQSNHLLNIAPSLVKSDIWARQYGLDIMVVSDEIWMKEPLLQTINRKFPVEVGFIVKMPSFNVYNWHTDGTRAASINLKLSFESKSHTLFGTTSDDWNDNFIELEYKFKSFYLFNTQTKHTVINFDTTRYLFTVQFLQSKDTLSYKEIYEWCNQEGLFDE